MTIAVDFDGTIVEHAYPAIGREKPFAVETLKMLVADGHRIILWTVREGDLLDEAVNWCEKRGVKLFAVNKDFPEENENEFIDHSRKLKVDMFIDDRNVGGLPDWGTLYQIITTRKTLQQIYLERMHSGMSDTMPDEAPKRKWWQIF